MLSAFNLYSSVHENIIKVEYFLSQVLYILSDFSTSHINLKIQALYQSKCTSIRFELFFLDNYLPQTQIISFSQLKTKQFLFAEL